MICIHNVHRTQTFILKSPGPWHATHYFAGKTTCCDISLQLEDLCCFPLMIVLLLSHLPNCHSNQQVLCNSYQPTNRWRTQCQTPRVKLGFDSCPAHHSPPTTALHTSTTPNRNIFYDEGTQPPKYIHNYEHLL